MIPLEGASILAATRSSEGLGIPAHNMLSSMTLPADLFPRGVADWYQALSAYLHNLRMPPPNCITSQYK